MTQRTYVIEENGRYDELHVDGAPDGTVAVDYGTEPPEIIIGPTEDGGSNRYPIPTQLPDDV